MTCTISTEKPGSTWLDRLRSSRGFPPGNNLDLGHFLTQQDSRSNPSSTENGNSLDSLASVGSKNRERMTEIPNDGGDKDLFNVITNVLSELFNMGDEHQNTTLSRKRGSRKQAYPRICVPSTSNGVDNNSFDVPRDINVVESNIGHLVERKERKSQSDLKRGIDFDCTNTEDEGNDKNDDLVGYSRSEVTIIDTSCGQWKFEKLLFRKKNIWKVRDKKGKERRFRKKKRKASCSGGNGAVALKKKLKLTFLPFGSAKQGSGEEGRRP